jgi:RNA:NAD 2'-phosphotransferase (TPT1/KptA family)
MYQGTKRAEMSVISRSGISSAGRRAVMAAIAALLLSAVPAALSQKSDPSWLPVNIVYIGDVHGKFEPCG